MIATDKETKSQKRMRKLVEGGSKSFEKEVEVTNQETGEITETFVDDSEIELPELPEEADESEGEIELEFNPNEPTYKFRILKLFVKGSDGTPSRFVEILVIGHLSKMVFNYDVLLTVDTSPFDRKIAREEEAKLRFESQEQTMIDDFKIAELEKFDERILQLKKDRQKLVYMCPDISFFAKVQCVDDSGNYPKFEFQIHKEVANKLNSAFELISNYKMQLQFSNK